MYVIMTHIDELARFYQGDKANSLALAMQIIKLQEEIGEVAEAYIGFGQYNPRKTGYVDIEKVQAELVDVITTALVALCTTDPARSAEWTEDYVSHRIGYVIRRAQANMIATRVQQSES